VGSFLSGAQAEVNPLIARKRFIRPEENAILAKSGGQPILRAVSDS